VESIDDLSPPKKRVKRISEPGPTYRGSVSVLATQKNVFDGVEIRIQTQLDEAAAETDADDSRIPNALPSADPSSDSLAATLSDTFHQNSLQSSSTSSLVSDERTQSHRNSGSYTLRTKANNPPNRNNASKYNLILTDADVNTLLKTCAAPITIGICPSSGTAKRMLAADLDLDLEIVGESDSTSARERIVGMNIRYLGSKPATDGRPARYRGTPKSGLDTADERGTPVMSNYAYPRETRGQMFVNRMKMFGAGNNGMGSGGKPKEKVSHGQFFSSLVRSLVTNVVIVMRACGHIISVVAGACNFL
jgi:hypothetical protein